jgi:hypothetical protein
MGRVTAEYAKNATSTELDVRAKNLAKYPPFGRLTALRPVGRGMDGSVLWLCRCACGEYAVVASTHLLRGVTASCGCAMKDISSLLNSKGPNEYTEQDDGSLRVVLTGVGGVFTGYTVIDKIDLPLLNTRWWLGGGGYVNSESRDSSARQLHRAVMLAAGYALTAADDVDHKDGDPCNNRRSNLRIATSSDNGANRKRTWAASGYKGVYSHGDRWRAQITKDQRRRHLGLFNTPEEAARAYNSAAGELFGEFAHLNIIPKDCELVS